ncbi:MAG: ECF transporter S component, partial [Ruthenibacterium sp.]
FLKLDISAVPVMLGSFLFGPVAGIMMAALKAAIHLFSTQTGGVGELADFIITGSFAMTAGLIYRKRHSKAGARLAAVCSVGVIALVGCLANWFILLPFYRQIMPIDAILAACSAVNPAVTSPAGYIWFGVLPFNLLKGSVVCVLTFLLYKRLSGVIHRFTSTPLDKSKQM